MAKFEIIVSQTIRKAMVRTIVRPDKNSISFEIPEKYIGKEIEVIAFETAEGIEGKSVGRKVVSFDAISLDTRGFQFNRDEANE